MVKVRVSADCITHGFNKILPFDKEEILSLVSESLNEDFSEIIIKKEPVHNTPEENLT